MTERLHGGVPAAALVHFAGNVGLALFAFTAPVAGMVYVVTVVAMAAGVNTLTRPRHDVDGSGGGQRVTSVLSVTR